MSASRDSAAPPSEEAGPPSRRKGSRSRVRLAVEHGVFRVALGTLKALPRGSAAGFGRLAGRAFLGLATARRRILLANLRAAFPEKSAEEIAAIARGSAESFGAVFMEFLESSSLAKEEVVSRVALAGEEHLAAARARGKGVFLLSAHFGSWELGAVRAGLIGEPISSVVRPLDNPRLERELARRRTRFGNRLIPKRDAAREILRAIRSNETVAILVDQNVIAEEAIFVPFFGRPAATTPSLALLQMKTGAAVVPVFTWPLGGGRYRLEFEPPILPEHFADAGDRDERVWQATARYMDVTEAAIRKQPEAWLWMHNRWRTRPG